MSTPLFIQIKGEDNVAIAVEDIAAGTQVMPGVTTREDIPQAHKLALTDSSCCLSALDALGLFMQTETCCAYADST